MFQFVCCRHFTVDLQEESGSIFSRQLYRAVRSAALLQAEETHLSQPCLVHQVLQPHNHAGGLHWTHWSISMCLIPWSPNLDVELTMSSQVAKICVKRW